MELSSALYQYQLSQVPAEPILYRRWLLLLWYLLWSTISLIFAIGLEYHAYFFASNNHIAIIYCWSNRSAQPHNTLIGMGASWVRAVRIGSYFTDSFSILIRCHQKLSSIVSRMLMITYAIILSSLRYSRDEHFSYRSFWWCFSIKKL